MIAILIVEFFSPGLLAIWPAAYDVINLTIEMEFYH